MTVIVAVKCRDAVVLATDSQATSIMAGGSMPMKQQTQKVTRLGKYVVYAFTGGQGAGQRIDAALQNQAPKLNVTKPRAEAAQVIRATVNPLQQQVLGEWVKVPQTQPETWGALFCGWSKEGGWIFEVDAQGISQFHDTFAAMGSGHAVAHAALINVAHFDVAKQSVEGAKAIAYRAIESTCLASAFGVDLPVQIGIVMEDGVVELNDGDEEHTNLMELVDLWKSKEVETLGQLAPRPGEGAVAELPEREETPAMTEADINGNAS